jgi:hypothetical protein
MIFVCRNFWLITSALRALRPRQVALMRST